MADQCDIYCICDTTFRQKMSALIGLSPRLAMNSKIQSSNFFVDGLSPRSKTVRGCHREPRPENEEKPFWESAQKFIDAYATRDAKAIRIGPPNGGETLLAWIFKPMEILPGPTNLPTEIPVPCKVFGPLMTMSCWHRLS